MNTSSVRPERETGRRPSGGWPWTLWPTQKIWNLVFTRWNELRQKGEVSPASSPDSIRLHQQTQSG